MLIVRTETELGTIYGKVRFIDLLLSVISMYKNESNQCWRWILMRPIKDVPFYRNYKILAEPIEEVSFVSRKEFEQIKELMKED